MKIGIIGLPNVGKTALYNLLTNAGALTQPYPFTTIDANHGMAALSDGVLESLGQLLEPQKLTHAQVEIVDIAGLIKDAHKGEGLGNRFLSHIRDVDMVVHVLRGFYDESIPHVFETVDPARDREIVLAELALADLEILERRLEKERKRVEAKQEVGVMDGYLAYLSLGNLSIPDSSSDEDRKFLKSLGLLTPRPRFDVLNLPDSPCSVEYPGAYRLSVSLEQGIAGFSIDEARQLRSEIGVEEAGISGLLDNTFDMLGLIRFYTIKGDEVRAWALPKRATALEAASRIHSDIAQGFIKAEVVSAHDLLEAGSWSEAVSRGKMKIEGKDYIVHDHDVLLVKFR